MMVPVAPFTIESTVFKLTVITHLAPTFILRTSRICLFSIVPAFVIFGFLPFDFKFGTDITASSDKKLAELRENLSELKLIIIDEMSLVSADMLYKIDAKLKEIFNLKKDIPFAGIGIVWCGDLLQIPPVKAGYIFCPPKNEKSIVAHDLVSYESE